MNNNEICVYISDSLIPLFASVNAPQAGVCVRTPMLYPDGDVVDVFVLEQERGYTITDFGEAIGWGKLHSVSEQRPHRHQLLINDICQTLGIELNQGQLVIRSVAKDCLGESVLRIAQAVVRVADLYYFS